LQVGFIAGRVQRDGAVLLIVPSGAHGPIADLIVPALSSVGS